MGLDELFEKGLLKRVAPSAEKAEKSLQTAERYLAEARGVFEHRADMAAILSAYSASFHAARALLFRDGVSERSHAAVGEYLAQKHPELGKDLIGAFNLYRGLRHAVAYGIDTVIGPKDSAKTIEFAEKMIGKVKELLAKKG